MSFAIAATHWKVIFTHKFRLPILVVLTFILDLVLVLVFAGNNFNQEFYGTFGRATGFVAYVSLAGLLIAGIISASSYSLKRFSWFLISAGAFSMVYGVIQALGVDPVNWAKGLNPVIGFVGNPNFQSSFVAFSAIVAFAILIRQSSARIKAGLTVFLAFAIFVIYKTQSKQGFVVLAGGIAVILFVITSPVFLNIAMFEFFNGAVAALTA